MKKWLKNLTQPEAMIYAAIIGALALLIGGYFAIQASLAPKRLEIKTTQTAKANELATRSLAISDSTADVRDIAAQTLVYINLDDFMSAFGIPIEIKPRIFVCPNGEETWCLSVYEQSGEENNFHFKNVTKCTQQGKQADGTPAIPAGFDGMVKGFSIRPCNK